MSIFGWQEATHWRAAYEAAKTRADYHAERHGALREQVTNLRLCVVQAEARANMWRGRAMPTPAPVQPQANSSAANDAAVAASNPEGEAPDVG